MPSHWSTNSRSNRCTIQWLTLVAILGLANGCREPTVTAKAEPKPLAELGAQTILLEELPWPTIVRVQGALQADEVAAIGTKVAGKVAAVHVDLGDYVELGEPLVTLETHEFRLAVEQAQAQLAQARSAIGLKPNDSVLAVDPENSPAVRQERALWEEAKSSLQRASLLLQQNAIAMGEYDLSEVAERVAEARYAASLNAVAEKIALIAVRQAELDLARQRQDDSEILAPFDGYIQTRHVAPGSYVNIGSPIVSLVRIDPLWFRGTLPERYASRLEIGQDLQLRVESVPDPIALTVTRISPSLELTTRSLLFEAQIDNSKRRFRGGLFAQAEVVLDPTAHSLVVPASSVTQFAGTEKVWKVSDGISGQQEIITGVRRGDWVEVLQGLSVGDSILADASRGQIAKIISTTAKPDGSASVLTVVPVVGP